MLSIGDAIRRLNLLMLALFLAASVGLVYWQVLVAGAVTANPHNGRLCLPDSAPVRGRIFDRNGVLLAESLPAPPGAGCGYVRHYTDPDLAGLLGYYISPLYGSTGIEAQYDAYLSGRAAQVSPQRILDAALHHPPVGSDIYLTIDLGVQRLLERAFDADANVFPPDGVSRFATDRGSAIVTDPRSGQILALLSRPGYDPNRLVRLSDARASGLAYYDRLAADPGQPLLDRPLDARYVPGSIYKVMTLLAGLDTGSAHLSDLYDARRALGPVVINGEAFGPAGNNIAGYTHAFPVDLRYGFAHSDNVIFAQLGAQLGAATWLDYNRRFYVGGPPPFDLPAAPSSVTPPGGGPLSPNALAEGAFGQGVDFVSPLGVSLINAAIADDGHLMRPRVVLKIISPQGQVVQAAPDQLLGSPVTEQTASQVRDAMYGATLCGTGAAVPQLRDSPWAILSKTGTGEVGGGLPAQSWLIAQAPYQHPLLSIVAMREHGGEGGKTNGPLVADLFNGIFTDPHLPAWKPPLPPAPDPLYCQRTGLTQA
jgi:peptidoglycan glycosyltransferase